MADTMAASSGGVDWTTILKPFLTLHYETSNKSELLNFCSAIIKSETEILRHKEHNKVFFNNFVVLSADYISSCANKLSVSQIEIVSAACRVLLKYLLNCLQTISSDSNSTSVQIELYLNAVKELCVGTSRLSTTEVTFLVNIMKGENLPQHPNQSAQGADKDIVMKPEVSKTNKSDLLGSIHDQLTLPLRDARTTFEFNVAGQSNVDAINTNDPISEINKLFLKTNIESLQALKAADTLVDLCLSLPTIKRARTKVEEALAGKPFNIPTNHSEATTLRNCLSSNLSEIKLAISAINLPVLEPLTPSKLDKLSALSMAVLYCAISQATATAVLSIGTQISPKTTTTTTTTTQQQQSQTSIASSGGLKEDDYDSQSISLIEESLNMYTFIGTLIKNSTRAGGHVYQNHLLAGTWVLISGLQTHLNTYTTTTTSVISVVSEKISRVADDKGRSPCKSRDSNVTTTTSSSSSTGPRSGLQKYQQSFSVLLVALATKALNLLTELFDDLHLEACTGLGNVQIEPAPLTIMGQFTALQRVARILTIAPLNNFLFYLAIVCYRKACTLKRINPPEGDTFSQSDSTTYYEDMIMCSDEGATDDDEDEDEEDDDEDDDSEPILGQWFEETLAPPEIISDSKLVSSDNVDSKSIQNDGGTSVGGGNNGGTYSIVPEKGEANSYITLATNIFLFLNKHMLCTKSTYVARYVKTGLSEQQMIILAAIIRDLDKETSKTEIGTICSYFGPVLGQLYCEFSGALTRFTHNLITHNNLNSLQVCLLNHLGVSPWNTDVPHAWPLQVYPRTLLVLTQVLLLRPQNEKEASVISIWHRLVNTLIENVLNPSHHSHHGVVVDSATVATTMSSTSILNDNEDLNVEHAQVLLFLFHSLNLMQKKSVVLLMAGGVLRCSEVVRGQLLKDYQLLNLSRLLLLFDYIMKHLYDAPTILLEQIQWNLFNFTNLNESSSKENNLTRMYTAWPEIEDNYRKLYTNDDNIIMKPRFYSLTSLEINNQESPKLDGLACNFILGTPDKLRYPLLLDALIEILNITNLTTGQLGQKLTFLSLCCTQYCFTICWRLLQLLPPSNNFMEKLSEGEENLLLPTNTLLLYTLIWGPRILNKNCNRWLKDCLVKQGLYTQHTDKLLKTVSDNVNTLKFDINNTKNCIINLTPSIDFNKKSNGGTIGLIKKENLPPLSNLFLLDSMIAKVQTSLDESENSDNNAGGIEFSLTCIQDLFPFILKLTESILFCTRCSLLHSIIEQNDQIVGKFALNYYENFQDVLAISSNRNCLTNILSTELISLLPMPVSTTVQQQWKNSNFEDFSLTNFQKDSIPSESFILKIIDTHISTLSMNHTFSINFSLKRLLQCLMKFICDHAQKIENTDTKNKAIEMLVSITLDLRTEYLYDTVSKTLDKLIGDTETDEHQKRVYLHILKHTYNLIINYTSEKFDQNLINIDEQILHNCLIFYEKIIEKSSGRQALEQFFTKNDKDLVKVLMSVSNSHMSQQYSTRVLHFFNKLFQAAEKSSTDPSLNYLCSTMSKLANVESNKLQEWLRQIIIGSTTQQQDEKLETKTPAPSTGGTKTTTTGGSGTKTTTTTTEVGSKTTTTGVTKTSATAATTTVTVSKDQTTTEKWTLTQIFDQSNLVQENSQLLQALTSFIVKQDSNVSDDVSVTILKALIPLGSYILSSTKFEGVGFTDLMVVMVMLADAGTGKGHMYLFPETAHWIDLCDKNITEKKLSRLIDDSSWNKRNKSKAILEAGSCILEYIVDVLNGISNLQKQLSTTRSLSPPWEYETPLDLCDYYENQDNDNFPINNNTNENNDDDSSEDSDEDSLCNKLCTFTITQKEFMNQHWYHCHTCNMLDGVGVCSICARVCHKGHDLSYAKYGNFFCDCGAKEDGSCQALVKRQSTIDSTTTSNQQITESNHDLKSRRASSPIQQTQQIIEKIRHYHHQFYEKKLNCNVKQLESSKDWILNYISTNFESLQITNTLINFINTLLPSIEISCNRTSPVGCYFRAIKSLQELQTVEKKFVYSDQLMVPTLGSQEGAFENVRMNYSGEQGQTIRQLLSAHIIRRVAMCCMTSSQGGRRQHLAVSHEKGKITVLQLSALLKQADSSTRKLTLTRLSSAPIPFTVLSLSSNLCNEDYLSVCGLKDCHVLTFSTNGTVIDHLVLHPQLETGNFIIKSIWLPGSQTKLALITADFVKIYDLSVDSLSPQYYFLVPSGKIRDCTFMYSDNIYHILLMSSPGHIYTEVLNEESSAKHGSFYVTNTLEVFHLDVTDVNGQVAGGGVSIYYSHTLGLLFYSYAQGKSFISPITPKNNCLTIVYPIQLPSNVQQNNTISTTTSTAATTGTNKSVAGSGGTSSSSSSSRNVTPQPLCQWSEIPNHPGLIYCSLQSSNNPIILMLKPDTFLIQEIRVVQIKSKIMDIVAIRHNSGNELRTTLILLCEDGSLKMYTANMDQTGYWMSPNIQPIINNSLIKPIKKKKLINKTNATSNATNTSKPANSIQFPVDFFEHCQLMNDVEIGGNDLLQIYNVVQLKYRLNATGLYVACNKPLGFNVEITNNDNNLVMTGIRVLIGSQDIQKVPSFIEVFGRIITISINRSRWYDIPFSREESLQADKKIIIMFGPSQDSETLTMIDSIKVYGKTKDSFGWPDDNDETNSNSLQPNNNTSLAGNTTVATTTTTTNEIELQNNNTNLPVTKLERLTVGILEALENLFNLNTFDDKLNQFKQSALKISMNLLTLPIPPSIQIHSKALLSSLHNSKQLYHYFKDQALLQHVLTSLMKMTESNSDSSIEIDAENYYRLVLIVRGIAVSRPQNLLKFSDSQTSIQDIVLDDPLDVKTIIKGENHEHLLLQLIDVLWLLHSMNPQNYNLSSIVSPGLKHTEQIIYSLVEIVHAFNSCDTYSNITIAIYLQLLLCKDSLIAFSAKQAICKVLKPKTKRQRKVFITNHHPSSGSKSNEDKEKLPTKQFDDRIASTSSGVTSSVSGGGSMLLQRNLSDNDSRNLNTLEALLSNPNAFPPLLDIPPDADDETMVELAIALSLQEHDIAGGGGPASVSGGSSSTSNNDDRRVQPILSGGIVTVGGSNDDQSSTSGQILQETGHFSDTTASANGSDDDEGSTAATDGSTLRTSPACEQVVALGGGGGSVAGSESGGSGVESITGEHNVSGHSSAYGDNLQETVITTNRNHPETEINPQQSDLLLLETNSSDNDLIENSSRLHILRLQLLERLTEYLPKLRNINGVRAIPFLQVVLQLTTDLDGNSERDRVCLNSLLAVILQELELNQTNLNDICIRTPQREVQLLLMRLLSVFMSRCKSSAAIPTTAPTTSTTAPLSTNKLMDNCTFVSRTTATILHKSGLINHCNKLLQSLLDYWTKINDGNNPDTNNSQTINGNLLKERLSNSPPDMTPFFLKQFVKEHSNDIFLTYPHLLTEMALRLPYQVHKYSEISESITTSFDSSWFRYLCEYMMQSQIPFVRRQVRKLLLFICGNKEKYRQLRDLHSLNTHMKGVNQCCVKGGFQLNYDLQHSLSLSYDTLVDLIEHLKACLEIAISRTGNWQRFCIHHEDIIPLLIQISCLIDEGVAPTILQLLQCAIVVNPNNSSSSKKSQEQTAGTSSSSSKSRKEREKSDDSATEALFEEANCVVLVEQINKHISKELFQRFIKIFMLETNITTIRWQVHALILSIHKNSKLEEQELLLELLWKLWPLVPIYGRKASQFVDLLGYFSLKFLQNRVDLSKVTEYIERAIKILRAQNELLAHHPNSNLYSQISQYVELDGYYLESEPCLVCNNPEIQFTTVKLSSLKVDSKFTTTTQIVKLLNSHVISKITIRIGDLKRSKMVRTINIYYNNRNVQAIVELKNKPALWHKAKKVQLQSGQTEIKIDFPLPIVTCNLMIEYADFYENIQASSETLQCPRCSAAVPANPGVCANCGENVFQCHKCRAINYDEKDPFLCHACGFCKYAKFDFTLLAKPCCAVEPIENDDDRKKMISSINSLLEKADRVYKQLIGNKPSLESLVLKISEHSDRNCRQDDSSTQSSGGGGSGSTNSSGGTFKVNKTIQMLAQQYCNECKTSFEELSKIIQKVLVSRKELVAYDRKNNDNLYLPLIKSTDVIKEGNDDLVINNNNKCYGCSTAATEHCLTLLRALASNKLTRTILCKKGLIQELVFNNLRKGSQQIQEEVKQLLCVLTKDNLKSTEELCNLIMERISLNLNEHNINNCNNLNINIRNEISLLAIMIQKDDECWELKLRCIISLFLKANQDSKNPLIMETIILPCLQILYNLIRIPDNLQIKKSSSSNNSNNTNKNNATTHERSIIFKQSLTGITINVYKWLDNEINFNEWKENHIKKFDHSKTILPPNLTPIEIHQRFLIEKYSKRWLEKTIRKSTNNLLNNLILNETNWLKPVLFNTSSRLARQVTCNILQILSDNYQRKKEILILLTCFLEELTIAGESSAEFLNLYQILIQDEPWKQYLSLQGVLMVLANLIIKEIEQLHNLELISLTSDLAQGYALNQLTELLSSFLDNKTIRRQYKSRLVGSVLNGYLSLRRLIVQRTRLIDDTQEKLLELLEEMTSGTEEETKQFMSICIDTVEKCNLNDILTPVFIFERLCSIIYPEENDIGEFFLTLEKDSQQEDFLQGRMLGNPYSSLEIGLGPLMRDVKNKICQDCELVALLEDDNGMELLVNNKIISLDLLVKDVYKKIWLAEGGDHDAMRIVYRMRGLLGDATEEFIETLTNKTQDKIDNEEVYKMSNVLAECNGLTVMIKRLNAIQNIWRAKPLLQVLLKLFRLSVKVTCCQNVLIRPELGAMEVFLRTLQLCLENELDTNQTNLTEQLLDIMETILSKSTSDSMENFEKFSQTFGGPEYIKSLLKYTTHSAIQTNQSVLVHFTRVLAALVYGNEIKMKILLDHFNSVLDLDRYDCEHTVIDQQKLEMLCVLTNGIERNNIGNTLKDYIISLGIVNDFLNYITRHAPCVKPTLLRTDSDELKDFISKPALKYNLRFLTGLAYSHENTQLAVATANTIPIIHRIEQVSSDEHVGSLAENLLEALCTNETVAKQIEQVREYTRSEKKRLAMAMREKQLGQLGMRTNDKGQVTAKSTILQQIEELGDETGLVCCICREGYKYQPTKVLGIYTFTKRCNVDEFECKTRRTVGYTTVSHFNIVHIDCHMSAVRLARARDEWESAALQNANTKCNGLLPLWGPQVPESAFASCLARHNTYLQESTNHRDIGHSSTIHDLKLLLLKFAHEKSFHEDTGGGGPQSNLHMVPYLVHIALYVINTTRVSKREESSLMSYLKNTNYEKWIESAYDAEGPLYWATMSVLLHSMNQWNQLRVSHLDRLIVLAHIRHCQSTGPHKTLNDKAVKDYVVYKPYLIFFGLIDGIYKYFFKNVSGSEEQWSTNLADYIRHNDEALLKASEKLLASYTEELLPCTSFSEFCDVAGLLDVLTSADTYISDLLNKLP